MRRASKQAKIVSRAAGAAAVALMASSAGAATPVNGVWNNFTDASIKAWTTPGNWTAAGVPNAVLDTADLSVNSGGTTTPLNVDVGASNVTVSSLTLGLQGAAPQTTTILSSGGSFILDFGSTPPGTTNNLLSNGTAGDVNLFTAPVTLNSSTNVGGTNSLTFSGTVTNSGNRTITNNLPVATASLTFGAINLTEAGAVLGRTFTANNGSLGGVINLNGVISDGAISSPNNQVQIQGTNVAGSTVNFNVANTYGGSTSLRGNITLNNDSAFGTSILCAGSATPVMTVSNADHVLSNNLMTPSNAGFSFTGTKNLTLNGFFYATASRNLTNNLTSPAGLLVNGRVFVKAASNLTFDGTGTTTIAGVISNDRRNFSNSGQGPANISKSSTGTVVLTNANNQYSGTTTTNNGTLKITSPGALGYGSGLLDVTSTGHVTTPNDVPAFAGTFDFNGNSPTVSRTIQIGRNTITSGTIPPLEVNASLVNNAPATTVTLGDGMNLSIAGTGYTSLPSISVSGGGGAGASASINGMILGTLGTPSGGSGSGAGYQSLPTITVSGGGGSGGTIGTSLKINKIDITNGGSGYTSIPTLTVAAPPPALNFAGNGASSVAAVTTSLTLKVGTAAVTNGGSGYDPSTTVTFPAPPTGTTATGTVTVNGSGVVTGITITDPGSGYTSFPTPTINGIGSGATAVTSTVGVFGITVTAGGNNYTAPPPVTITGGGGSGATAATPDMGLTGTNVLDVGTGYTSLPTVTVTGGSPTTAASVAVTALTLDQSQLSLTTGSGFTSTPSASITGGGGTTSAVTADYGRIVLATAFCNIGGDGNLVVNGQVTSSTAAGGLMKIGTGTTTLANSVNNWTGATAVSNGTLVLKSNQLTQSSIAVTGGTLQVFPGTPNRVLKTPTVSISGGKMDLGDAKLIVTTAGSTGSWNGTNYDGVSGLIRTGRNSGAWNGNGLMTSQAAALGGLTTLAVAKASDVGYDTKTFAGQSLAGTETIVMYTYAGDADLNGTVNGDDYARIDAGYVAMSPGVGYINGDFNYDGKINADDYYLIDRNYSEQGALIATGPLPSGVSAVPEPAALSMLGLASIGLLRRRRVQH